MSNGCVVRADVGLQQSRQTLSPDDLVYVESVHRSEIYTTGWVRQHTGIILESEGGVVGGGVHRLSPTEGVSKRLKSCEAEQ